MPTFTKNTNSIQCSQIQTNHMQCTRAADMFLPTAKDPNFEQALCKVCWLLKNSPKEYTTEIRKA